MKRLIQDSRITFSVWLLFKSAPNPLIQTPVNLPVCESCSPCAASSQQADWWSVCHSAENVWVSGCCCWQKPCPKVTEVGSGSNLYLTKTDKSQQQSCQEACRRSAVTQSTSEPQPALCCGSAATREPTPVCACLCVCWCVCFLFLQDLVSSFRQWWCQQAPPTFQTRVWSILDVV